MFSPHFIQCRIDMPGDLPWPAGNMSASPDGLCIAFSREHWVGFMISLRLNYCSQGTLPRCKEPRQVQFPPNHQTPVPFAELNEPIPQTAWLSPPTFHVAHNLGVPAMVIPFFPLNPHHAARWRHQEPGGCSLPRYYLMVKYDDT